MPQKVSTKKTTTRKATAQRPAQRPAYGAGVADPAPFVEWLSNVGVQVEQRLERVFEVELEHARSVSDTVSTLVESVRELTLRGGKRLRPGLLAAGYRSATTTRGLAVAFDAGVALELLQSYFLIHDDWMDHDTVRRGGPSVHVWLGDKLGDAARGEASAILAGDYAATLAAAQMTALRVPPARLVPALATFCKMQRDALFGQQLDLASRTDDIESVYALKTASYSVAGPLRLGAELGGGSRALLKALDAYALPIGIAFQLSDDVLSVFGDPERTGKPFASDLRAGKRTLLVSHALGRAQGPDKRALERVLGNAKATEPQLRRAVTVLETSGARERVRRRVAELVVEGLHQLEDSAVPRATRALLTSAATALTARSA